MTANSASGISGLAWLRIILVGFTAFVIVEIVKQVEFRLWGPSTKS